MQTNDNNIIESAPSLQKKSYTPPALRNLDAIEDTAGKTAQSGVEAGPYTNPS